jgi:hypothetical protein
VRSSHPALKATVVVAIAAALSAGMATTAQAGKTSKGKPGSTTVTATTSTTTTIANAQAATCGTVADYTSCTALKVTIANQGATGYAGNSSPATSAITYNSYYAGTQADWSNVVAHEVGGHIDAWNELVAKVGTTQAWTDYYDLDYFGKLWAEGQWKAVKGTARTFTLSEGKEAYLDCAGPVAHGFQGNYLYQWGFTTATVQKSFCTGSSAVMTNALTKVRPA